MTDLKHHTVRRAEVAASGLRHVALTDWATMGAWVRETARLAVVEHAVQTVRERADGVYDDAHNDEPGRA